MNLEILMIVLIISLFFITTGYLFKGSADIFQIVGFAFLFLIGMSLIPGTPVNVEYTSGTNITAITGGYQTVDITTTYKDFTTGFFIAAVSIFGFVQVYTQRKGKGDMYDD